MDTNEINSILKNYAEFKGAYPRDMMPFINRTPAGIIVNTDSKNKSGEHWIAIFLTAKNKAEYFDSFGLPPLQKDYYDFFDKHKIKN